MKTASSSRPFKSIPRSDLESAIDDIAEACRKHIDKFDSEELGYLVHAVLHRLRHPAPEKT
jgi:hypothetical protein